MQNMHNKKKQLSHRHLLKYNNELCKATGVTVCIYVYYRLVVHIKNKLNYNYIKL